jgi:hypothetical protein
MKILYEYMVTFDLPAAGRPAKYFDEGFTSLIPAQRAVVNKLMKSGVITSYAVSLESSTLWVTMIAETDDEVREIISGFPIIDKVSYIISKLAFRNTVNSLVPQFSLN